MTDQDDQGVRPSGSAPTADRGARFGVFHSVNTGRVDLGEGVTMWRAVSVDLSPALFVQSLVKADAELQARRRSQALVCSCAALAGVWHSLELVDDSGKIHGEHGVYESLHRCPVPDDDEEADEADYDY